jgi:CcmD family protein
METPTPDTYPALFWGYLLIWGLLAAYILFLGFRCARLEKKLKEKIEK